MNEHILCIVLLAFCVSCTDILNKEDPSHISPEIWDNEETATIYINSLYDKCLPEAGFGENSSVSDESPGDNDFIYGNLSTGSVGDYSLSYYEKIREINIAIEETENGELSQEAKYRIKGQAYFLRAWMYWGLVKLYGGVPIILESIDPFNDEFNFPRNKTSESINQIVADLDSAIAQLPSVWPGDERGRITRGAAAALKGRVLLFWASPQFNPNDSQERWERAYTANSEAKQLLDQDGYGLHPSFEDIFLEEGNQEVIFARLFDQEAERTHGWENSVRPRAVGNDGGTSSNPTMELVRAFPMENGLPIDHPQSGYDPELYYKDRDPRFYATVAYNGTEWEFNGFPSGRRQWHYYVGETSIEPAGPTTTGFYCRKAVNPDIPQEDVNEVGTDWIEIRYAEVLLNLAESANAVGAREEAYDGLTAIRERAGIEPGADNLYGLSASMSRQEMTNAIIHERQIEFAFENKRYWDLRRHNLFAEELNGTRRHGIRVKLKPDVDPAEFEAMRDTIDIDTAYEDYFDMELWTKDEQSAINFPQPKYNFFAIPPDMMERNSALEQTQEWGGAFDPLE